MSEFAVTIEKIEKIWSIEGADAIELAKVERFAFQFVIGKNQYKVGDLVIYFPVDSILPESVMAAVGMIGKFSGKNGDRVKTKAFKGQISQGFVTSISSLLPILSECGSLKYKDFPKPMVFTDNDIGMDLNPELGVVKYEPPVIEEKSGNLLPLPDGISKYDIEGCDRNPEVVDLLMDKQVRILEKLEGQNASIQYCVDGTVYVSQRNFTIKEIPGHEHAFWKLCRDGGYINAAKEISVESGKNVLIRFEYLGPGVQKNIYRLNKPTGVVFDIKIGGNYISGKDLVELTKKFNLPLAPVLAMDITLKEWLNSKTVQEASNGESSLFKTKREGIVITPMSEETHHRLGRLIIKQRSPDYLATSEF